ncbi:MAG TPA: GNAT family N-acetyltransferase [Acidimicrobiales bacterium]|nr:GNAT family N-acetyltransferase [Acidimicrobiales bacterium]
MDRIRGALAADAPAIGALQAESWRHTYRGFLPDAYLDGEVFEDRDAAWRRRLATAHQHRRLTLVAEDGGALVGFAHAYVDDDAEWGTLLETLNVRPDRRRSGTGTRLMAVTAARLQRRGCTSGLYLWVAEWNRPAQRFYDALGGCVADRALADEGGGVGAVATLRYAWPRLDLLSSRIPTA